MTFFDKRLDFAPHHSSGERSVLALPGSGYGDLDKTASSLAPGVLECITSLPDPGDRFVRSLITALSAFEAFGVNRNGDGFLADHLVRPNTYEVNGKKLSCPMHESFVHFAKPFRHHINRPDSPSYGKVLSSFFNPKMLRVELIAEWDREKAPDICESLERGDPVGTSMGFRCNPGDVCSICGNLAKSRLEYCSHLRNDMLKIYPDGRIAYAVNPWGKFFDISAVSDPADRTSRAVFVMKLPGIDGVRVTDYKINGAKPEVVDGTGAVLDETEKVAVSAGDRVSVLCKVAQQGADAVKALEDRLVGHLEIQDPGTPIDPSRFLKQDDLLRMARDKEAADKRADIFKRVAGEIELSPEEIERIRAASKTIEGPSLSKDACFAFAKACDHDMEKVAATAYLAGIDLYAHEWQCIGLAKDFPKTAAHFYDKGFVAKGSPVDFPVRIEKAASDVVVELAQAGVLARRGLTRHHLATRVMDKSAFAGSNPYIFVDSPAPTLDIPEEEGSIERAALLASLILGARLLSGDTTDVAGMGALLGISALAGAGTGHAKGRRARALPMREAIMASSGEGGDGSDFRLAAQGPLAYQMMFGKTASLMPRLMHEPETARHAVESLKGLPKTALAIEPDYASMYSDEAFDRWIVSSVLLDV